MTPLYGILNTSTGFIQAVESLEEGQRVCATCNALLCTIDSDEFFLVVEWDGTPDEHAAGLVDMVGFGGHHRSPSLLGHGHV